MADFLSEEQISEYKEAFCFFDKNGDGSVTTGELKTVMHSLGMTPTDEELEQMVREVDLDGNGRIEFNEFLIMMSRIKKRAEIEVFIREAFKKFDNDKDGLIEKEQLEHVLVTLGDGVKKEEIAQIMDYADTEGDGIINYEFIIDQYLSEM